MAADLPVIEMPRGGWRRVAYAAMQGLPVPFWAEMGMWPLWLASQGYRAAAYADRMSYECGLRRRRRLPCRVFSIGNLTVGGTGKTPLTEWMAQWLQRQGWRVAVLSRGYGGASGERPKVASTGEGPLTDWRIVGDEAYLLSNRLSGVPVVVGRNRYKSGVLACEKFGAQVLVLDDGFQHHALHRDSDIVLIDATNPLGHGALLPRGILREPLHALRRAQAIVLTRVETAGDAVSAISRRIRRYAGRRPIYQMAVREDGLYRHDTGCSEDFSWLEQRRVIAFAGLGNPQAFAASLVRSGARVAAFMAFPDHHPYTLSDWQAICDTASREGAEALVTTEKDAVRLEPTWLLSVPVYSLRIRVELAPHDPPLTRHLDMLMGHAATC
ncbi:MAG: tetraacyldisaccharide 4'-kinase [Candidatus Tectomicrobia bacterium]|nr:tetraacyldisaccharide 4'-kinase [Candidatus Tectomicrobia bacterium]